MPKPNKTGDYTLTFRVDEDLLKWIDKHAEENVRSRAQEIEYLLRRGMAEVDRDGKVPVPNDEALIEAIRRIAGKSS